MFNPFAVKFFNVFRLLSYLSINFVIKLRPQTVNDKTILLVRLDSIGDYLLNRNYFNILKQSKIFKDYKITLCGNSVWKDLAETFDKDVLSGFIWVDRKRFYGNPFYMYRLLKQVNQSGFEVVINPTFSRENLFGDLIVNSSSSRTRIGSSGAEDSSPDWKRNLITNKYYTSLIPFNPEALFEFNRGKEFFGAIINEKINLDKPILNCPDVGIILPTKKEFAVIFPGAQEEKRQWSSSKFEMTIEHLISKYNLNVIIAGSAKDSSISRQMTKCRTSEACFDLTGKTSLPQLAKLISLSKILISNETSAVHFAAAVGTPFVCISNGNHFGRFNPYPEEMNIKGKYVYPEEIENNLNDFEFLSNKYRFESMLDINSIHFDKVKTVIAELL